MINAGGTQNIPTAIGGADDEGMEVDHVANVARFGKKQFHDKKRDLKKLRATRRDMIELRKDRLRRKGR